MNHHNSSGFNHDLDIQRYKIISKYFKGDSCIEIGSGNYSMTKKINKLFRYVHTIEPEQRIDYGYIIPNNMDQFTNHYCRVEDLKEHLNAQTITCNNVLEHIEDVPTFLKKVRSFGDSNSVFIFSVPNAASHNRLLGMTLGMINHPGSLDKQDIEVGHKKMYGYLQFKKLIEGNGFKIIESFTSGYKPFKNSDMMKLPEELKKYCLDMRLPFRGCEIFVIAKLK